jgi:endonuclease YncB( thermonuclease family)
MMRPVWLLPILLAVSATAWADTLMGRVVAIVSGDTIRVADARSQVEFPVRLAGIEAPGRHQPNGGKSQQVLGALLFGRDVQVEGAFGDGRFHGRVLVAAPGCHTAQCPRELDAGLEQVAAGMAWWDPRDGTLSTDRRGRYEQAEFQAKIHRLGLWSGRETLPPWGRK